MARPVRQGLRHHRHFRPQSSSGRASARRLKPRGPPPMIAFVARPLPDIRMHAFDQATAPACSLAPERQPRGSGSWPSLASSTSWARSPKEVPGNCRCKRRLCTLLAWPLPVASRDRMLALSAGPDLDGRITRSARVARHGQVCGGGHTRRLVRWRCAFPSLIGSLDQ